MLVLVKQKTLGEERVQVSKVFVSFSSEGIDSKGIWWYLMQPIIGKMGVPLGWYPSCLTPQGAFYHHFPCEPRRIANHMTNDITYFSHALLFIPIPQKKANVLEIQETQETTPTDVPWSSSRGSTLYVLCVNICIYLYNIYIYIYQIPRKVTNSRIKY